MCFQAANTPSITQEKCHLELNQRRIEGTQPFILHFVHEALNHALTINCAREAGYGDLL